MSLGTRLGLLMGPTVPLPAPAVVLDNLESVEVKHADGEQSGFQITIRAGKGPNMGLDLALMELPLLKAGMRVILTLFIGAMPKVLMDGFVTRSDYQPSNGSAGPGKLVLTGKDISFAMEREEKNAEHPAQPDPVVATKIIASYALYGLIPIVVPPPSMDVPIPTDRTPMQTSSDLEHLQKMAERYQGWVFHVTPGPLPGANKAYWGPDLRVGIPQPALSVDMGSRSNVETISFENDASEATQVRGSVQDRWTGMKLPVFSLPVPRVPLALSPAIANFGVTRTEAYRAMAGRNVMQALAEAQAKSEKSSQDVVKGTGELDTGRYGGVLEARGLVGVRGVGLRYDGLYYVKSVTHKLSGQSHKQEFEIVREGTISTVPAVPVGSIF